MLQTQQVRSMGGCFTGQNSIVPLISKNADMLCAPYYLQLSGTQPQHEIWDSSRLHIQLDQHLATSHAC